MYDEDGHGTDQTRIPSQAAYFRPKQNPDWAQRAEYIMQPILQQQPIILEPGKIPAQSRAIKSHTPTNDDEEPDSDRKGSPIFFINRPHLVGSELALLSYTLIPLWSPIRGLPLMTRSRQVARRSPYSETRCPGYALYLRKIRNGPHYRLQSLRQPGNRVNRTSHIYLGGIHPASIFPTLSIYSAFLPPDESSTTSSISSQLLSKTLPYIFHSPRTSSLSYPPCPSLMSDTTQVTR